MSKGDFRKCKLFQTVLGATTAYWNFRVEYVETPSNKIVIEHALYVDTKGWSFPAFEVSPPDILAVPFLKYNYNGEDKTVKMDIPTDRLGSRTANSYVDYVSYEREVFPKTQITATTNFVLQQENSIGFYNKNLKINF